MGVNNEDPDPVIIEYKGVKWKLKAEPPLTFLIKTLLETKPGLIAEEGESDELIKNN